MKENKYHAVGLVLKSNRKIVEGGKIATPSKQTLDNSLSCVGTGISLKSGRVKLHVAV